MEQGRRQLRPSERQRSPLLVATDRFAALVGAEQMADAALTKFLGFAFVGIRLHVLGAGGFWRGSLFLAAGTLRHGAFCHELGHAETRITVPWITPLLNAGST